MKIVTNYKEQKQKITTAIKGVITEIFTKYKDKVLDENAVESIKKDISSFLEILRKQNKIYDYVVIGEMNDLFQIFEFEIAYSLINSDEAIYQDYIKISISFK